MNTISSAITQQQIQAAINWLKSQSLPILPVAPAQNPYQEGNYKIIKENLSNRIGRHCPLNNQLKPIPKYTGKNPSYLDPSGLCQLVNHRAYQSRLPSNKEIELWYANSANGIGTLGGWNNTIWLDFDTKQFCDQDSCDTAVLEVCGLIKEQTGVEPFLEKSHSGGWHIGVRVNQKPTFTNFALTEGGKHVGEALGEGRFVVLAPTIGPSGKSYESINRCNLPVIESLESIGVYAAKGLKNVPLQEDKVLSNRINIESYVPNAIPLESLGNELSRQILNGANPTGDRSQSLTTAIKEWYGWQNWAKANNITYSGSTEQLAAYAGGKLGLDDDRIVRILKTIDPDQCHPAALSRGSEESCWKKIRRLSKKTFESKCPNLIKNVISEWNQPISSNKKEGASNVTHQKAPMREAIAKTEKILKAQIGSQIEPIEASILLEELRREVGVNEYNWDKKYLQPIREKLERALTLPNAPTDPSERKRIELKTIAQERDPYKLTDKLIEFCRRTGWTRRDVEQQIRLLKNSTIIPKAKRLNGKAFLSAETESISWVFPGIIPNRGVVVVGGHAGAGKTTLAYDAGVSMLLDEDFLGEKPVRTGSLLIVTGDELPCFTQDKLIDRGIPLDNDNWEIVLNWDVSQWDVLEEAIADIRPTMIIIDSFSSIHRDPCFDENSSQAKSTIYDLEALTNAYGCGCLLIHHLSKSKENQGVAKLRGSSAISAAASVVCLMEQTSDGTRKLSFPKVRGAQTDPFLVALDGSTGRYEVVSGGDDNSTKSLGERVLAFLHSYPYKRFEQEEISSALGIPSSHKDSVYQALGRLFKRGLITKRPSQCGGKRKVYGVTNPCQLSHSEGLRNVTDRVEDTHPPLPVNVSVQIPESHTTGGGELTDTLTDTLTDSQLTPQNDVPLVSGSNTTTVGVTAKLTNTDSQGCVCPPMAETVTHDDENLGIESAPLPAGISDALASASEEVAEFPEPTLEEEAGILACSLADEAVCPDKEELAVFRQKFSPEVLQAACKQLSPGRHAQTKQWVVELNAEAAEPQAAEPQAAEPQAAEQKIQVGDQVFIAHWPHTDRLAPYLVERIEGEYAKVECFAMLIPLAYLRKA